MAIEKLTINEFDAVSYKKYFVSVILSLTGLGFFLYTQGWFILSLNGSGLSMGLSWSIFFTPSLLVLPLFGRLMDSIYAKKTIVICEFAKAFLLLIFIPILYYWPYVYLVYILSSLMGILFAMFAPSIFVVLKSVLSHSHAAKYSYMLEVAIQIGSAVSIFCSGYIYSSTSFVFTLFLGGLFLIMSGILICGVNIKSNNMKVKLNILEEYRSYLKLFADILTKKTKDRKIYLFGIFHQLPQNIILVLNIPLILYVNDVMKKGPVQYGILDALIGVAAMFTGLFWARHHKLAQKKVLLVLMPAVTFIIFLGVLFINPLNLLPYLLFCILGIFLSSSKIQCRAVVLLKTPAHSMGKITTFYQLATYLILIFMSFAFTYLLKIIRIELIFVIMGLIMLIFSLFILLIIKKDIPQGADSEHI